MFRNDRDALLARADALERENRRLRGELEARAKEREAERAKYGGRLAHPAFMP